MKRQIIAVDMDDVLAASTEALRKVVNEHVGVNLQPEHYQISADYWGYYEKVWEKHGIAGQVTLAELDPQMQVDQRHISPMDGAKKALLKLSQHHRLIVVTARSLSWEKATLVWLDEYLPGIFDAVIFADGHKGIQQKNKGRLCQEAGATWLIDDNIEHAKDAMDVGISAVVFGDYGWHHVGVPDGAVLCKNWKEVEEFFDGRD